MPGKLFYSVYFTNVCIVTKFRAAGRNCRTDSFARSIFIDVPLVMRVVPRPNYSLYPEPAVT